MYQRNVQLVCSNAEQQIIIVTAVDAVFLMRNKIFSIFQRPNEVNDFAGSFAGTLFVDEGKSKIGK